MVFSNAVPYGMTKKPSCGIGEKTYWENERPAFTAWQVGEAVTCSPLINTPRC